MMSTRILGGLFLLILPVTAVTAPTQLPQYFVPPAAKLGSVLQFALVGQPGHVFASYADLNGGPRLLLGEEVFLGLSPALTLIDTGVFGIGGLHVRSIQVPAAGIPTGVAIYLQSLVLDSQARVGKKVAKDLLERGSVARDRELAVCKLGRD